MSSLLECTCGRRKGTTTRLLECLHSVCEACRIGDKLQCPICRRECHLDDVDAPVDILAVKHGMLVQLQSAHCGIGDHVDAPEDAVTWCTYCETPACASCTQAHRMATQHSLVALSNVEPQHVHVQFVCSANHPRTEWCLPCNKLVCAQCGEHVGHTREVASVVVDRYKATWSNLVARLPSIVHIGHAEDAINQAIRDARENVLLRTESPLKALVDSETEKAIVALQDHRRIIQTVGMCLVQLSGYPGALATQGSPVEILAAAEFITSCLRTWLRVVRHAGVDEVVSGARIPWTKRDPCIYIIGGLGGSLDGSTPNEYVGQSRPEVQMYNLITHVMQRLTTQLPNPRERANSVTIGDYIYVLGGMSQDRMCQVAASKSVDRLDVRTHTWTTMSPMPSCRVWPHAVFVPLDDCIYVLGGSDFLVVPYTSMFRYDTLTDMWTTLDNAPEHIRGVTYIDHYIYAVTHTYAIHKFNLHTTMWELCLPGRPKDHICMLGIGWSRNLFALSSGGGRMEKYNTMNNTWTPCVSFTKFGQHFECEGLSFEDNIYIVDWGYDQIQQYNPRTDTWTQNSYPLRRRYTSVTIA